MASNEVIYIIGRDEKTGPYRVGKAINPTRRALVLGREYPFELRVLATGRKVEHSIRGLFRYIQHKLRPYHLRRGWYDVRYDVLNEIVTRRIREFRQPVGHAETVDKWREKNRAHYNTYMREYRNPSAVSYRRMLKSDLQRIWFVNDAVRQSLLAKATPGWHRVAQIRLVYQDCVDVSLRGRINLHVVHRVPLEHEMVCGLHWETNLLRVREKPKQFDQQAESEEYLRWLIQQGL